MLRLRGILMLGCLAVSVLLAACAPGEPGITIKGEVISKSRIAQGKTAYEQICAACHGLDGQGQFPDAPYEPDATGRLGAPPHNEGGHTWHHSDELLIRYVIEGGFADPKSFYEMPSFGTVFTRSQAENIIAYIKTMWTDEQLTYQHHMTAEEERLVAETR